MPGIKHSILSIFTAAALCISLTGCSFSASTEPTEDTAAEELPVYSVGICYPRTSPGSDEIVRGFNDALNDMIGQSQLSVTTKELDSAALAEAAVYGLLSEDNELLFTVGPAALSAAAAATHTTPIVGADIINYRNTLHLLTERGTWDRLTERNITGVSSTPSIQDQVSLLIEATPDLKAVGILYSPLDADAIYQNEVLEHYLDEAGIPWKEYEITETPEALAAAKTLNATGASAPVVLPSMIVASSGKEGPNLDVESIGEDGNLAGINSPESARTAKISATWNGGKNPAAAQDLSASTPQSTEDIVTLACEECSVLYISAASMISDQIDLISSIATAQGVSTLGGDVALGESSLVCLYSDPYDQGYRAGKMAYNILVNDADPAEMRIASISTDNLQKLYNDRFSVPLGLTFPKSFSEIDDFLKTYEPGTYTTRSAKADEEKE